VGSSFPRFVLDRLVSASACLPSRPETCSWTGWSGLSIPASRPSASWLTPSSLPRQAIFRRSGRV